MKPADLPPDFSAGSLLAEANRCVACGLCLPHCPTYRKTLSEADSPRGRIALMSGVASGRIPMNERFALHIDRCLTCRTCEAVCPNHVAYGQLVGGARAMLAAGASRKHWLRGLMEREFIAKPARFDKLRPLLRFYQQSGLQGLLRKSGLLGKTGLAALEAQLPAIPLSLALSPRGEGTLTPSPAGRERVGERGHWQALYPATGKPRGEVGLFLGCIARLADAATLNAAIFVLNRLGYTVHLPPAQTCCGALHQHGGDTQTAALLAQQNLTAFDGLKLQAIISTASGCGAQLAEYPTYRAQEMPAKQAASGFSAKVMDISAFLATAEGWDDVNIAPLSNQGAHKIAVHEPCSLRNVLRGAAHPYALLARIPDAQIVALAGNDQCCGAAGTYFLDQPEMAKALLDDKMVALNHSGARYLVSSNVGCALHLASGLRQAGLAIEVLHPVTLLARQTGW